MSVRIDSTLQTYLAAVTIPGDFHGLPDGDFEVALGSYTAPGAFQAPDAVSINSTVSVTLTGRLGAGKSFDPTSGTYWLWGRATRAPDETLTRGSTRITVVTTGGTPVGAATHYVPQQTTAPDPTVYTGWLDSSTTPPTLKGWNGTAWVAIGGGGGGGVTLFNTRAGSVTLTKADVTGTGLAASDVGADTAAARDTAIATQHTTDVGLFQPVNTNLTTIGGLDSATAGALVTDGAGWFRKTYAQLKTALALVKADVGLGSVDNTADTAKPVSTLQATADGVVQAFAIQRAHHTGTQSADTLTDGTTNKAFLATERTKLAGISGSNTGDQTITLTGDVTGTGTGSFAATLASVASAGTTGDATHSLTVTIDAKGRVTAVTANAIVLPESAITNLTTDLAAKATPLTKQAKTANYTAVLGDMVLCDTTGGTFTVTLPAASGGKGRIVVKWTAGTTAPSIAVTGSDHIDTSTGSTGGPFTLLNQAAQYESDGTALWAITADNFALSTLDSRYANVGIGAKSGAYYGPATASLSTVVPTLNLLQAKLLVVAKTVSIVQLLAEVTAAGSAGAVGRLGLWADGADGYPAALIVDAGTIDCTTTGVKTVTVAQTLTPGRYWLSYTAQVATATVRGDIGRDTTTPSNLSGMASARQVGVQSAGVTGALPGTFPATLAAGQDIALVYMKVA